MDILEFTLSGAQVELANTLPVTAGVPMRQGEHPADSMFAVRQGNTLLPTQHKVLGIWPDGSIRWLLLDFAALPGAHESEFRLTKVQTPELPSQGDTLQISKDKGWSLSNDTFTLRAGSCSPWLASVHSQAVDIGLELRLRINNQPISFKVNSVEDTEQSGPLRAGLVLAGYAVCPNGAELLSVDATFTRYASSPLLKLEITLHNPKGAKHAGGLWDLGDPNSVEIQDLAFVGQIIQTASSLETRCKLQVQPDAPWETAESIYLEQVSSGGCRWNATTHKDKSGRVNLPYQGYRLKAGNEALEGLRADPKFSITCAEGGPVLGGAVEEFWQRFPSAIEVTNSSFSFKMTPSSQDVVELQPGEKFSRTMFLSVAADIEQQLPSVDVSFTLPSQYWRDTRCLPRFAAELSEYDEHMQELIRAGVDGECSFFSKRELIDEFGWRNFGELYADHEAINEPGLVSHYNNQYDPVMGFLLQYTLSDDRRFLTLANDLARHIVDIDIYHTKQDRKEYANGMFWHTDHYLDAETCTHRSVSAHHNPESYWDYQKGGGPGMEHCYTTGLLYHYYLTGATKSRDAVVQLGEWIEGWLEPNCMLDALLLFKRRELPALKARWKGETPRRFPFTRGTGNMLNSILDLYELTADERQLRLFVAVTEATIDPRDDISTRHLEDVENTWSYTVFLQAIVRYLDLKFKLRQLDSEFLAVRAAFLHYADWMRDNEVTYLSRADTLEHPNATWVAQESRKSAVLYAAAFYASTCKDRQRYLARADEFLRYCIAYLSQSEERSLTRIIILLMQNHLASSSYDMNAPLVLEQQAVNKSTRTGIKNFGWPWHRSVLGALKTVSLRRELLWLAYRSESARRLLEKLKLV